MAKTSGLGQLLLAAGYDLSGDTSSYAIHGGPAPVDVTGLDKSARERVGGLLDGGIDWSSFFNPVAAQEHAVLSSLPTADVGLLVATAATLGQPAVGCVAKQVGYDPTRGADGSLTIALKGDASGFGVEWCDLLTAGKRTDTAATNGTAIDGVAATITGWSAYLQVPLFTGVDVTVKLQDSADNVAFADVVGGGFTQIVAANRHERIAGASGATLRRYVRAVTVTTGGFTSVTFACAVGRHPAGASA